MFSHNQKFVSCILIVYELIFFRLSFLRQPLINPYFSKEMITIPKPCHEDWNKMTPESQGKFCAACQKTVVDFTAMSQEEVLQYLNDYSATPKICGRFRTDQLNTPTVRVPLAHEPIRVPYFSPYAALLVGMLYLQSCTPGNHPIMGAVKVPDSIYMSQKSAMNEHRLVGEIALEVPPVDSNKINPKSSCSNNVGMEKVKAPQEVKMGDIPALPKAAQELEFNQVYYFGVQTRAGFQRLVLRADGTYLFYQPNCTDLNTPAATGSLIRNGDLYTFKGLTAEGDETYRIVHLGKHQGKPIFKIEKSSKNASTFLEGIMSNDLDAKLSYE